MKDPSGQERHLVKKNHPDSLVEILLEGFALKRKDGFYFEYLSRKKILEGMLGFMTHDTCVQAIKKPTTIPALEYLNTKLI